MVYGSINLNVGDRVNLNTKIGKMGNTGNSTGTHLHLEASTTEAWQCSSFVNPCTPLGFPNERGTVVIFDGTIPPEPTKNKNSIKWLMARNKKINFIKRR